MSGEPERLEVGNELNRNQVIRMVRGKSVVHEGVSDLKQLVSIGAETPGHFVGFGPLITQRTHGANPCSRVPAGTEHATHFRISGSLVEIGNHLVGHLEMRDLSVDVPRSFSPLNIQTIARGGQVARRSFTREIVRKLPIEIRAAISGCANAESLTNGVTDASRPVRVLILVENAARVRGRGSGELGAHIEGSDGPVHLGPGHSLDVYAARIVSVACGNAGEPVVCRVITQKK